MREAVAALLKIPLTKVVFTSDSFKRYYTARRSVLLQTKAGDGTTANAVKERDSKRSTMGTLKLKLKAVSATKRKSVTKEEMIKDKDKDKEREKPSLEKEKASVPYARTLGEDSEESFTFSYEKPFEQLTWQERLQVLTSPFLSDSPYLSHSSLH